MSDLKSNFDEQGYVAYKSFLDGDEISEVQRQTARFLEEVAPGLPEDIVYYENKEDVSTIKQVQKLYDYDEFFLQLAKSDKVVGLAETLLGGKVELQNMQYFNKVPGMGKATPAHQDGYYFMIRPQEAVTMWLSLGDADASNGAVCYIPGSHKKGIRLHGPTSTLGFSQGISDWSGADDTAEVQMEAGPGDILVHHSLMIHRANKNGSERDRKSLGFIFYRDDVEIDEDAHAAYKETLHQSLSEQGKI
jgi:phytanoyl-CoA hydroxylase